MLITSVKTDPIMMFAEDVRAGLTKPGQKELPSKYFYDEIGSALFDVITILPEYVFTGDGGGTRKRQWQEGAVDSKIPRPASAYHLLPYRTLPFSAACL